MTLTNNHNSLKVFDMSVNDVLTFLNNQVVSDLNQPQSVPFYTAICNPKGRIIFTLFIQVVKETTYLAANASLSDNFLQYVNMRKFRMDVNITNSTKHLNIQYPAESSNYNEHIQFISAENTDLKLVQNFWLFMFNIGLPWITQETTEQFIPQHVNLDLMGIIAFDKGCYPGQEIVARLHFLGSVKKRMKHIILSATDNKSSAKQAEKSTQKQEYTRCSPSIIHHQNQEFQAIIKNQPEQAKE